MTRVEIEPVDRVEITVLMDNLTDPLLVDQDAVAADELAARPDTARCHRAVAA